MIYLVLYISVNKDVVGVLMVIFLESYFGINIYFRKFECLIKNKIIRFICKLRDLLFLFYYVICCCCFFFICRDEVIIKLEEVILMIVEDIF